MPNDLYARLGHTLRLSKRKSSVTHLARLVSVAVARFLGLTFDGHAVFKRLQHATWPTYDLHLWLNTTGDLDISLARDTGGDFDEPDLVFFKHVNTLLRLRLLAHGRCGWNAAPNRCPG